MSIPDDTHLISLMSCGALSSIGCILIISSALLFKKLQTYAFRLVTYLSIADLFASLSILYIGFLIPGYENEVFCLSQAVIQNYSQLVSLLITGVISYSLYQTIVLENTRIVKKEKLLIFLSFAIPAILTPLPFITNSYGNFHGWCWILNRNDIDIIWVVVQFYGPLVIMLFVNIFFYFMVYRKLWSDDSLGSNKKLVEKMMDRLKMYPLVLLVCFGPSLFHRVYYIAYKSSNLYVDLISGCMAALYGFFNAFVYGFTTKFKKNIRKTFGKLLKN